MTFQVNIPDRTPALSCIVCHKALVNEIDLADNQPRDGVVCNTHGNYGSRVYDSLNANEYLEFNVCDDCLVKASNRGEIVHVTRTTLPPVFTYDTARLAP